jgi:hypothetical protein
MSIEQSNWADLMLLELVIFYFILIFKVLVIRTEKPLRLIQVRPIEI